MRVLVACEYSGTVRDAFIAKGHDAMSCDLLPTDSPGPHYQGDVVDILDGWLPVQFTAECDPEGHGECLSWCIDPDECFCVGPTQDDVEYIERNGVLFGRPIHHPYWDLMIAHPPCTYLSSSGLHWNKRVPGREEKTEQALRFVQRLMNADIKKIAVENPIGRINTAIRKPDQYIQPHEHGHDASKKTGLWLKNLPALKPTKMVEPRMIDGKPRWGNQTDSGQNKLAPSEDRWKIRSTTYQGWARAMAEQWGTA